MNKKTGSKSQATSGSEAKVAAALSSKAAKPAAATLPTDEATEFFRLLPDSAFFGSDLVQHVYLYGEIDSDSVNDLKVDLAEAAHNLDDPETEPKPIVLHLNSPGGSCFSGMSMMSVFNECRVPICVCVDGKACSAATLISILAPYRVMTKHSVAMVHDYASFTIFSQEKRDDILFNANQMEEWTKDVKNMYIKRSRLEPKELDKLMARDLLLDSSTCVKMGLCDRVLDCSRSTKEFSTLDRKSRSKNKIPINAILKKVNLNHFRFEIDSSSTYNLKAVRSLDRMLASGPYLKPVIFHIDDQSSSWFPEPAILERVVAISNETDTYAILDTHVALLDFLPALFCHRRVAYSHATVVIHLVYDMQWAWMLRDVVENTSMIMDKIRAMLRERTRLPPSIVDNIHSERFFLNAEDCLKYGLVDEVINLY